MTKIDTGRVSAVLRSLATEKLGSGVQRKQAEAGSILSIESGVPKRDKRLLRDKIKIRLKSINENDENFNYLASSGTIKEVLIWEFSDEFVSHPEFGRIVKHITMQILDGAASRDAMEVLIQSVLSEA